MLVSETHELLDLIGQLRSMMSIVTLLSAWLVLLIYSGSLAAGSACRSCCGHLPSERWAGACPDKYVTKTAA